MSVYLIALSPLQCTNGHLMCAGCFIHLLADARLKEEQATCPNCRCEISKSLCCRNLAVEKAVSELPTECGFCMKAFPRALLERHKKEECQDRCDIPHASLMCHIIFSAGTQLRAQLSIECFNCSHFCMPCSVLS